MTKRISLRALLLTLVFISIQPIVNAQQEQLEYGSIADLRGVTHIYVDTDGDMELHKKIVKEITKKLKNIVVTADPYEGEVCLVYRTYSRRYHAGTSAEGTISDDELDNDKIRIQTQSRHQYRTAIYGVGRVVILKPNNVVRIITSFDDSKGDKPPLATLFERKPSINFARAFVKAYKEANK